LKTFTNSKTSSDALLPSSIFDETLQDFAYDYEKEVAWNIVSIRLYDELSSRTYNIWIETTITNPLLFFPRYMAGYERNVNDGRSNIPLQRLVCLQTAE